MHVNTQIVSFSFTLTLHRTLAANSSKWFTVGCFCADMMPSKLTEASNTMK